MDKMDRMDKGPAAGEFRLIARGLIRPDPGQPRKSFDPEKLAELRQSIHDNGIVQPLVVSRVPGLEVHAPDLVDKDWRAVDASGAVVFRGE